MTVHHAIILAAGLGTRMKSQLPKVLHTVSGRPLVGWVVQSAFDAGVEKVVVVVGHGKEKVEAYLTERFGSRVAFAHQAEQKGTGHAVLCALPHLGTCDRVLIACGDTPLVRADDFRCAMAQTGSAVAILTATLPDATGYGRIVRDAQQHVVAVREEKDCSPVEKQITEWNTGMFAVEQSFLQEALPKLSPKNAQGELYLTDIVSMASALKLGVTTATMSAENAVGINDRAQLAMVEKSMRLRINEAWAKSGVTFTDLFSTHVHADVTLEPDVTLHANVQLRGKTIIRSGATIDVGCVLNDVDVMSGALLKPYTVATQSKIGALAEVGPFSHLRPDSELVEKAHIGNFVETKKTKVGKGSKANHLAYLGDGVLGEGVNVGAGTIFCNYDGFQKHTTVLEDGVFIGSDSHLVAPVRVGKNAYVGTGTTVTRDVPPDALAIARVKQENKEGYATRLRARFSAEKAAKEAEKSKK